MDTVPVIKEEPGALLISNIKNELNDPSQEPGQLKIINVFSIKTDLDDRSSHSRSDKVIKKGLSVEAPNVLIVEDIFPGKRYDLRKRGVPRYDENSNESDLPSVTKITKGKDREQLQCRRSPSIKTEPVTQSDEDGDSSSRSSNELAEKTLVSGTSCGPIRQATTTGRSDGIRRQTSKNACDQQVTEPESCVKSKKKVKLVKKEKRVTCDICSLMFFSLESLEEHVIDAHVVDKEFDCPKCHKSFISRDSLDSHMTDHEKEKDSKYCYKCTLCSKTFSVRLSLRRHMMLHTGERPHKCKLCPKSYVTSTELGHHEMNQHGKEKQFKCPKCSRSFAAKCRYEDHLRTHSNDKTIVCGTCNESFKTKRNLGEHRRNCKGTDSKEGLKSDEIGNDEKPKSFTCPVCSKTFARKQYLNEHKLRHLTVKPWKCKLCSNSYITPGQLEVHEMNRHGKPKRFKCPKCPNTYAMNFQLQQHLLTHSNDNNNYNNAIICEKCNNCFGTKGALNKHRRRCKGQATFESG